MKTNERIAKARRITVIGLVVNIFLTIGKLFAGSFGKSAAMLADGVHSLSDIVTDLIVVAFVSIGGKESDQNHHYGHGKYETFATMLVGFILFFVGLGIFWEALNAILDHLQGSVIPQPGMIAFYAALVSIVTKELLFWLTLKAGKSTNNKAVVANAWHHRSDALSSLGTALGISGAIFLGQSWRILDPIAGLIVSVFIVRVAAKLGLPSIKELLETALPVSVVQEIGSTISLQEGVKGFHRLRTRQIGAVIAIEVHVFVDRNLTVEASHQIATAIENVLRDTYGKKTHVGVHIEPYLPD